jgi:predicted DNA-binding transcriptional regulator AlpA
MGLAVSTATATLESPPPAIRPYIPNRLLSLEDLSELVHVNQATVREWVRRGRFPSPIRCGSLLRWEPTVVDQWLSSRGS